MYTTNHTLMAYHSKQLRSLQMNCHVTFAYDKKHSLTAIRRSCWHDCIFMTLSVLPVAYELICNHFSPYTVYISMYIKTKKCTIYHFSPYIFKKKSVPDMSSHSFVDSRYLFLLRSVICICYLCDHHDHHDNYGAIIARIQNTLF